ncbi:GntR family transcriptional regulator [Pseudoflavonifractor phocaeensis]|uniref:GntR family transcriptional regulator n=1 Tax=Pseudoflavonifractor phocaeensis TaxID=1870988 RepID=UPI00195603D6|nr:GntR family transcriptional regulator [Pseudoflavonifractor phocaeensis]MBM6926768.1 GntR family transcriptional regulator [Pseudoflavonifractor phocaeensis]
MQHKYQAVADNLRAAIQSGQYEDTMLLPTEQALCQQFQVSRQTVRLALSLLASEKLIERRQGSGSHILEQGSPRRLTVAVVTTYISNYIFPSILREIETVLAANNAAPTLFSTQNQVSTERRILQSLLDGARPDGILVEGSKTGLPNPNLDLYRALIDAGIPLVFMHGDYNRLPGSLSVLDDNYGGGQQLVEYLYRKGHKAIAGIFKNDDIQGLQRYAGYADALRDLGLPLEDQQVYWYNTESKGDLLDNDESWAAVDRVINSCTAVVCYNDEVASRLISYLLKKGIRIPKDMAVVSFDNSQYSELSPIGITSLSHGDYNVGQMAAELLVRRLRGEECTSEVAPWFLIERQSS